MWMFSEGVFLPELLGFFSVLSTVLPCRESLAHGLCLLGQGLPLGLRCLWHGLEGTLLSLDVELFGFSVTCFALLLRFLGASGKFGGGKATSNVPMGLSGLGLSGFVMDFKCGFGPKIELALLTVLPLKSGTRIVSCFGVLGTDLSRVEIFGGA